MTFSYNGAIPSPPNDPAADVGTMQTNAASIQSIIKVDHVDFNTAGGGQHKQVTFNANNVPAGPPPFTPPVLFTNGTPSQLFFYTGTAAQSSNQYYTNQNTHGTVQSSVLLLGGIILKWGVLSFSGSQNPSDSFNTAFPNNCINIQISILNNNATVPATWRLTSFNSAGFVTNVQATGNSSLYWFAIGN